MSDMKTGKISSRDWEKVVGTHNLFRDINRSVLIDYMETTPIDIVNRMLTDPHGTKCDGIATIYPNAASETEYNVRMQSNLKDGTNYNLDLSCMHVGHGGFLKRASSLKDPEIFADISGEITDADIESLPWLPDMSTALIVPSISIK
ncbi:MAG: hypothetical protein V3T30_03990, partial [Thermodesulfobacteriota bacterium]